MSSISKVLLILGAGNNIGTSLAHRFGTEGYKVATVSRKSSSEIGDLHVPADLTDVKSIPSIFAKVKQELGTPSVVVYNAAVLAATPADDPLALSLSDLEISLNLQVKGVLVAASEAKKGFQQLPQAASRTFIYTGNVLNTAPLRKFIGAGIGKAAAAHIIAAAAQGYEDKGYKFYYADERTADGAPVYGAISGEGSADFYLQLSKSDRQGPWLATFAKDVGYRDFGPYKL